MNVTSLHFLYVGPILFAISVCFFIVGTYRGVMPSAAQQELVWSRRFFDEETRELATLKWWQNYRIYSVLLLAMTGVLVFIFR